MPIGAGPDIRRRSDQTSTGTCRASALAPVIDGMLFQRCMMGEGQRQDPEVVTNWPREPSEAPEPNRAAGMAPKKKPANAGLSKVARPGLEPGTPRFSGAGLRPPGGHKNPANRPDLR